MDVSFGVPLAKELVKTPTPSARAVVVEGAEGAGLSSARSEDFRATRYRSVKTPKIIYKYIVIL